MAGKEEYRPQDEKHQERGFSNREGQPEIHYGSTPQAKVRLENGRPVDIVHLYMDDTPGQVLRWWVERESVEDWRARVGKAHEQGDPRYEDISADRLPSTVMHHTRSTWGEERIQSHYSHEGLYPEIYGVRSSQRIYTGTGQRRYYGQAASEHRAERQHSKDNARQWEHPGAEHDAAGSKRTEQEQVTTQPGENYRERLSAEHRAELDGLEKRLREQLRQTEEQIGEGFNGAEYVREQLNNAVGKTIGKKNEDSNSLLAAFDAVAYQKYSDTVQKEALEGIEKAYVYHDGKEPYFHHYTSREGKSLGYAVAPHVAGLLSVLAGSLDIPYDYACKGLKMSIVASSAALSDLKKKDERSSEWVWFFERGFVQVKPELLDFLNLSKEGSVKKRREKLQ